MAPRRYGSRPIASRSSPIADACIKCADRAAQTHFCGKNVVAAVSDRMVQTDTTAFFDRVHIARRANGLQANDDMGRKQGWLSIAFMGGSGMTTLPGGLYIEFNPPRQQRPTRDAKWARQAE